MLSEEFLIDLLKKEVEYLGKEKNLSDANKEKIIDVFVKALNDSFMDERKIYALLSNEGLKNES